MFIDLRERNIDQFPPISDSTGDWTHNLGVCPNQGSNLQPFSAQGDMPTQPTEPHSKGYFSIFLREHI